MGRDLCQEPKGWCYRETVSGELYRISVYFEDLEAALAPLEGKYPPNLIETLRTSHRVSSMIVTAGGVFACGLQIDKILTESGFWFDGDDPLYAEEE